MHAMLVLSVFLVVLLRLVFVFAGNLSESRGTDIRCLQTG